jgi:hypothetical protein
VAEIDCGYGFAGIHVTTPSLEKTAQDCQALVEKEIRLGHTEGEHDDLRPRSVWILHFGEDLTWVGVYGKNCLPVGHNL